MRRVQCLLLLLLGPCLCTNSSSPIELSLPLFLEDRLALPASTLPPAGAFPPASTREEAFVTHLPEEGADSYEELFKDFGDVIEEGWEDHKEQEEQEKVVGEGLVGSESREAMFRVAGQRGVEYDYDTGYEVDYGSVDVAEDRDSGYGAPAHDSYGAPPHQESYGSHDSSYGHDSGYKVQPKKPGPYGYETPNFKCEKSSETLYVTETEWTFDKKCYTVYKVQCSEGYDTGKGIGYQKHCNEFTVTRCRTVFDTSSEERCWTVYKKQCEMVYETLVDWEYEQKCTTSYEEECHGYGYHQECEKVPKDHCKQVPKKVEKQVPRTKCKKVPDKRCQDFPINVPRKECKEFPKTVCTQDPVNVAKKIPKKTCVQIPREVCNKIPRQIIKEVPKKVGKKVCTSTKSSTSYGHASTSYEPAHSPAPSYSAPADDYGSPPSSGYSAPPSSYSAPSGYGSHRRSSSSAKRTPLAALTKFSQLAAAPRPANRRTGQAQLAPVADHWALGPG